MADQRKEQNEDREKRTDPESAEGQFAAQGEAAVGGAMDGGPTGTGNTGAILPGGADSEFARTSGGQTMGLTDQQDSNDGGGTPARPTSEWNPGSTGGDPDSGASQIGTRAAGERPGPGGGEQNRQLSGDTGGTSGGQGIGTNAPIGGSRSFLLGEQEEPQPTNPNADAKAHVETGPDGADPSPGSLGHGPYGGSVTAAGGSSTVAGAGSAGLAADNPHKQDGDFAPQGRGARDGSAPEEPKRKDEKKA